MSGDDASDRFAGTATYYAEHRPGYGETALQYIVDRFDLDESDRVLDLGCGTGQIGVPLADHVGEVVGMDPNEAMLREARERAARAAVENVDWRVGSDADLADLSGPFRLVTMGRSFHWMDQERTLGHIRRLTPADGGVAILGDPEWLTRGTADWQAAVYEVAATHVDDLPERTGPVAYDDPWDELLVDEGFVDVEGRSFPVDREWTVDGVVGYVLSLSFCSPETVDDPDTFESDVRARLRDLDGGPFRQTADVRVIAGTTGNGDGDVDRGGR